ncbi:MAG: class I SAM-dependent methyltransferase [Verrucomicrobiota bacterium]
MSDVSSLSIASLLEKAIRLRESMFDPRHETAFRLFNGFLEGNSDLAIDLYAKTLVFHLYSNPPEKGQILLNEAVDYLKQQLPWIQSAVVKERYGADVIKKSGVILFGSKPDRRIFENGVWYSVDLCMNRDASLYLDTRLLRQWIIQNLKGKSVLNTFAYTGSLGVAAMAAGASKVVQLERTRKFLNVAKESYSLNGFLIDRRDFMEGDFWAKVSHLKKRGDLFDCVILDPPFFATSSTGTVDLEENGTRLINKIRPLIQDGGILIVINNALFLSGKEHMEQMEALCQDGYLKIIERIDVPPDFAGFSGESISGQVTDSAPFNHSTKILIFGVKRK